MPGLADKARAALDRGRTALLRGDRPGALAAFEEAFALAGADAPRARLEAARALHARGLREEARPLYAGAAEAGQPADRAEALVGLAQLLREAGELAAAARAARDAVQCSPGDDAALALLPQVLEDLGDDVGAASAWAALAARHPESPRVQEWAAHAAHRARGALAARALGQPAALLLQSRLLVDGGFRSAAAGEDRRAWRNAFAEVVATLGAGGTTRALTLVFDDATASRARGTNPWGAAELFGRLPLKLDEYAAAGVLFLSTALGLAPERARALLGELERGGAPEVNGARVSLERNGRVAIVASLDPVGWEAPSAD